MTCLFVLGNLNSDVAHILRLQELDNVDAEGLVASVRDRNTVFRLALDHAPVELILVAESCLLSELPDAILLGLVVTRSEDIVLVLLEQAEALSMQRLSPLLVAFPNE